MSKKLSTAQLPSGSRVSVVWPGLGMLKSVPPVMRRRSKSGSPGGNWAKNWNMSVSKLCGVVPGSRGAVCDTPKSTASVTLRE